MSNRRQKKTRNCARCIVAIYALSDKYSEKYILYRNVVKSLGAEIHLLINEVELIRVKAKL